MILSVDLAAKFSAACLMNFDRQVVKEFDSWGKTPYEFITEIIDTVIEHSVFLLLVEDMPYGLRDQFQIKPGLRMQGRIIYAAEAAGIDDRVLFVNPSTWQRAYSGVFKGKGAGAEAAAAELGYAPPNMLLDHESEIPPTGVDKATSAERAKVRAKLKKAMTDYVDAFLICYWAYQFTFPELRNLVGVQPIEKETTHASTNSPGTA